MSNLVEKKERKPLVFPKFDDIPVSTKTFIVMTNISIDIRRLFEYLPITPYVVIPKKRGRKKKCVAPDPNKGLANGSIITLDLANEIRGVCLKKKKKRSGKKSDFFRNSITVVMIIDDKRINFKITRNGKFQMTGCKFDEHAEKCVEYIWKYIKDTDIYTIKNNEQFTATFIPAMRNIDFSLGFLLNREALDNYINTEMIDLGYTSLLETNIGYTGVNIKVPVTKPITDLVLKRLVYNNKLNEWGNPTTVPYQTYLDTLKPKEQEKKLNKERFITFLVFYSGKCIMSSICAEFSRDTYNDFIEMIQDNRDLFEETLDE